MPIFFRFTPLLFLIGMTLSGFTQCPFDPTISGDSLLCPSSSGMLTTQSYDAYQWFRRPYGGSMADPIPGATNQSITLSNPTDVLFYFSVDATLNGCTERSPEVLVDGWVFLLPVVSSTGDFMIGNYGESILCQGDTMYFNLQLPYTTNITWFLNGNPIPGETSPTLVITEAGQYTVSGAPEVCPSFIQPLGLNLEVSVMPCETNITPPVSLEEQVRVFPNPVTHQLTISTSDGNILRWAIRDVMGKEIIHQEEKAQVQNISVTMLPPGTYWVDILTERGKVSKAIIKKK